MFLNGQRYFLNVQYIADGLVLSGVHDDPTPIEPRCVISGVCYIVHHYSCFLSEEQIWSCKESVALASLRLPFQLLYLKV